MRLPNGWINRILVLLLLGYGGLLGVRTLRPAPPEPDSVVESGGAISAFFTHPGGVNSATLRGGPDAPLATAIDQAQISVDVAAYDLDLWSLRDALLRAYSRSLQIRVVVESDHLDQLEISELAKAGIEVRFDGRQHLMHHKFVIIDGREVWTGSMNFTVNGAYRNNNNLIRLRSVEVARQYSNEFEEMFVDDRFGRLSRADPLPATIQLEDAQVEVLFAPDHPVGSRIVELIDLAQSSIQLMAFNLTLDPIADALVRAAARGVQVQGVFEAAQADNQGSDLDRLRAAGVEVVLDGNPRRMHHKVIILDGAIVISGSYNFSRSAEGQNDENLVILHSPKLAELYLIEFSRLREQGMH